MSEAPNDANREPKRNFLWRKPRTRWWIGIPLGGVLLFGVGIAALAGFNTTMHETDSLAFCTSCHEMHDNMLPEYQMSPHFKNEAGVRAICSDCHVPKSFLPKMQAKISAALTEVPKWMLGTVGTKEKFTAVRLELAQAVWEKMKATDSRECRSCHSVEAMDIA